jgi:hypothetical protein
MDMAAVIFLSLVNETYGCNTIYSPYSICSVMPPSFCDYPSPSIANSPSTNDSVKGENDTGSFQFFLYFFFKTLATNLNILSSYMK